MEVLETKGNLPGYSNYTIFRDGRVYGHSRNRYIKHWVSNRGYAAVRLVRDDGVKSNLLVHRCVAMAFIENPSDHPVVNHLDRNQLNNDVTNLEWTTQRENVRHGFAGWIYKNGNRTGIPRPSNRTLNREQFKELMGYSKQGFGYKRIGSLMGISNGIVKQILKGKTYKDWIHEYSN